MSQVLKRLEAMRRNPRADWTIEDIAMVADGFSVLCEASRSGSSHYKLAHPRVAAKLTIPFKRPVKPVYIKQFVEFIDAVRSIK